MKKKDYILIFTLFIIGTLISSLVSVAATGNLFDSNEVVYDNTSSGMSSSNVKDAVDELYAAASDYSSLTGRVQTLENYFVTDQVDKGLRIKDDNDKPRLDVIYNKSVGQSNLVAYDSTGTWNNFGNLGIYGDNISLRNDNNTAVVKINGTDWTTTTMQEIKNNVNTTNAGYSSSGNLYYVKYGRIVIVNIWLFFPKVSGSRVVIATGLPKAAETSTTHINNANQSYPVGIQKGETQICWWWAGTTSTAPASGQLIYIAES